MTKEEQLRIYSAYLPYGLKLQHLFKKAKHKGETVLRSWVKPLEHLDLGCLFPHRKDSFDWKPILYDLSYLTKEIEHEGEVIIMQEKMSHLDFEWLIGNPKLASKLNQEDFEKLVRHHFNVFNLPEDQFINKANLTNK